MILRPSVRIVLALLLLGTVIGALPAAAAPIATDPFQRTWARTDQPVAAGAVSRTWMWGPEAFSGAKTEDYAESPGGQRTVQYFDKSRMEITHPGGDQNSLWYVTNGLLVVELVSGRMQTGDNTFVDRQPAQVNVAGDADDPSGPTYATFAGLRDDPPLGDGAPISQRLARDGTVTDSPSFGSYGVTAAYLVDVPGIRHQIASPFWAFMQSSGVVYENGSFVTAPLFPDPFYATGLPITEAYWASIKVGGNYRDVLTQCFERRCLTYTPDNAPEWQVEAGNVGQHYYRWRYPEAPPGPSAQANQLAQSVTQAASDEERYQALLAVMSALNVGVYTGQGEMIVGGAERGAADFYLYDIEVRMMAGAIGRGQTWGVIDLAMQLTAMGLLPEGQTLDPNVARGAILEIVAQASAAPQEFTSLSPLIVRQLGLSQAAPYDLFTAVSLEAMRFDALAFFLLVAHASVPLMEEQLPLPSDASSNLIAQSNGVLKAAAASTPCDPAEVFDGDAFKNAYGWAKNFADLMGLIPKAIAKASGIIDAIHGAILAFSVGVTELDQRLETHYGPGGHENEAGQPITFRIQVEMRDELPRALVDCGWITGTDFPPKGPISGVSVHWFWDNLEEHGQINCGGVCGQTPGNGLAIDATDASGIARMTFQPKNEENPDEGWIVEEHGTVTGVALYQSKFTNLLGSYAQYLTPKSGATRWVVKWHEPPGYNITMEVEYQATGAFNSDEGEIVHTASGSAVYEVHVPIEAVTPPHDWGVDPFSLTFTASGSGTFSFTNPIPGDYDCSGSWGGSFGGDTSYTNYDFPVDTPLTIIQVNVPPPPEGNYSATGGGCSGTGSPDMAGYVGITRAVPRNIDLDVRTPQTFVVTGQQMCANMGFDRCDGESTWTITVEFGGPPQ